MYFLAWCLSAIYLPLEPLRHRKPRCLIYVKTFQYKYCSLLMYAIPSVSVPICSTATSSLYSTQHQCDQNSYMFRLCKTAVLRLSISEVRKEKTHFWNTKPEVGCLTILKHVAFLITLTLIVLMWRIGWAHNNARK